MLAFVICVCLTCVLCTAMACVTAIKLEDKEISLERMRRQKYIVIKDETKKE